MPQLSPLKWFNLFIIIISLSILIMIKMNFFFINKLTNKKYINYNLPSQMKWKI
uniref:ATP synthase complex subunit 8 n=1 Tax=Vespa basalis TaxID=7444 RepID=A0A0U2DVS3_VESBA|nr:ATP synthase F0 subunit 8 [Vespa basalis]QHF17716.1 ATP synthase F0 subunit 8 [Vespa basalis]